MLITAFEDGEDAEKLKMYAIYYSWYKWLFRYNKNVLSLKHKIYYSFLFSWTKRLSVFTFHFSPLARTPSFRSITSFWKILQQNRRETQWIQYVVPEKQDQIALQTQMCILPIFKKLILANFRHSKGKLHIGTKGFIIENKTPIWKINPSLN